MAGARGEGETNQDAERQVPRALHFWLHETTRNRDRLSRVIGRLGEGGQAAAVVSSRRSEPRKKKGEGEMVSHLQTGRPSVVLAQISRA